MVAAGPEAGQRIRWDEPPHRLQTVAVTPEGSSIVRLQKVCVPIIDKDTVQQVVSVDGAGVHVSCCTVVDGGELRCDLAHAPLPVKPWPPVGAVLEG